MCRRDKKLPDWKMPKDRKINRKKITTEKCTIK